MIIPYHVKVHNYRILTDFLLRHSNQFDISFIRDRFISRARKIVENNVAITNADLAKILTSIVLESYNRR